jgi:DNA polymerase III epsilon subunit-like protein
LIITFIDTETTGLDLLTHEVIDVAALQVSWEGDKFTEISRFSTKIKPLAIESASVIALKINGYSKRKWREAQHAATFLPLLRAYIETSEAVVGQNLVFDYRFINKMFDANDVERPKWPQYIDTKWLADQLVHDQKLKRSSLDFLCEHYQIPVVGRAHTALTDVLRTFELFKTLLKETQVSYLSFEKPFDPYGDTNAKEKKN